MSLPALNLENQFGEVSINKVLTSEANLATPIAASTILSNITLAEAAPIGNTYADVVALLPNKIIAATSVIANLTAGTLAAATVTLQAFANKAPAKTGVAAVAAAAADADLPTAVAKINEILAALKVVS